MDSKIESKPQLHFGQPFFISRGTNIYQIDTGGLKVGAVFPELDGVGAGELAASQQLTSGRDSGSGLASSPVTAVKCPILDGLGEVADGKDGSAFEIGYSSSDFENAVMGPRTQALLLHGSLQQAF